MCSGSETQFDRPTRITHRKNQPSFGLVVGTTEVCQQTKSDQCFLTWWVDDRRDFAGDSQKSERLNHSRE